MKTIHITLVVFALALGAFAFHNIYSVQPKIVRINVRDLPSHGVRLISPTDPSFEAELAQLDAEGVQTPADVAKPFSVVLKNTSRRDIIGVRVRWDSIGPDGRTTTHVQSYSDMGPLLGMGPMNPQDEPPGGVRLKPQKARYLSLVEATGTAQNSGIQGSARGGDSEADATRLQEAGRNREQALAVLATVVNRSQSVTATLDAAIFDDGTVVGPDSLNYFEELQGIVKAKRDLLEDVLSGAQRNEPFNNIFGRVDSIAKQEKKANGPVSAQAVYYDLYKKEFAAELVRMRNAEGNDRKVAWTATRPLFRHWPKLRKG